MPSDPLWIGASAGAPSYTAIELRAATAALTQSGSAINGAQPGVRPGGDQMRVTLAGSVINVGRGAAIVVPNHSIATPYLVAFTATESPGSVATAHATLLRIDIVYLEVQDQDEDGSGQRRARVVYLQGTAGSGQPATPAGGLLLASINVPAAGSPAPSVTDARTFSPAGPTMVKFTANGTFTKADYPWARRAKVRICGGGSGGGGSASTTAGNSACGAGGGSGEYAEGWFDMAALGTTVTVTIGAGGGGGAAGANAGAAGGTTSFSGGFSANGGVAAAGMAASTNALAAGGGGGTGGTGGDLRIPGDDGEGGRVAGGLPVRVARGGKGMFGAVARDANGTGQAAGSAAAGYGAGGGGAFCRDTGGGAAQAGGNGSPGICIVELY